MNNKIFFSFYLRPIVSMPLHVMLSVAKHLIIVPQEILHFIQDDNRRKRCFAYYQFSFSSVLMMIPLAAFAASPDSGPVNSILESIFNLLQVLIQIGIVTAFLVFGWGVVRLIMAANNPAVLKQAKGILWWGTVGLFVLASLGGIIAFIKTYIGVPDNVIINVPKFSPNEP